jgi:hypothetical protein
MIAQQKRQTEELIETRMGPMETTFFNREYENSITDASTRFGPRFNHKEQGEKLLNYQQKLPGLDLRDAHRIMDYDNLLNSYNQLKDGKVEKEAAQVLQGGAKSTGVQNENRVVVQLSNEVYAKSKYSFEQNKGEF